MSKAELHKCGHTIGDHYHLLNKFFDHMSMKHFATIKNLVLSENCLKGQESDYAECEQIQSLRTVAVKFHFTLVFTLCSFSEMLGMRKEACG